MVKTFYSAEEIEALVARGQRELRVDEDTVLTQLARERARELGLRLVRGPSTPPATARAAAAGSPGGQGPGLGAKPRGCQHGAVAGRPAASGSRASSSDKVVGELVDLVKQLRKGSEG